MSIATRYIGRDWSSAISSYGDPGLWIFGVVCIAVGALLLFADHFGKRSPPD